MVRSPSAPFSIIKALLFLTLHDISAYFPQVSYFCEMEEDYGLNCVSPEIPAYWSPKSPQCECININFSRSKKEVSIKCNPNPVRLLPCLRRRLGQQQTQRGDHVESYRRKSGCCLQDREEAPGRDQPACTPWFWFTRNRGKSAVLYGGSPCKQIMRDLVHNTYYG